MKKAFLVTFCPTTRIVVDIEEDQFDASLIDNVSIEDGEKLEEIVDLCLTNMLTDYKILDYINSEYFFFYRLILRLEELQNCDLGNSQRLPGYLLNMKCDSNHIHPLCRFQYALIFSCNIQHL